MVIAPPTRYVHICWPTSMKNGELRQQDFSEAWWLAWAVGSLGPRGSPLLGLVVLRGWRHPFSEPLPNYTVSWAEYYKGEYRLFDVKDIERHT